MLTGSGLGQFVSMLVAVIGVMKLGLAFSGVGHVSQSLTGWLSRHTELEEPDPTVFQRWFDRFFDELIAPVGNSAARQMESPLTRALSFQLTIGFTVILLTLAIYLVSAGVIAGTVIAAYQSMGVVIDPAPLFVNVVSIVVFFALVVMFHAETKVEQVANR